MSSHRCVAVLLLATGSLFVLGCDDDPITPSTGFIVVTVIDSSGPAVAGVEIRILPDDLFAMTDDQGVALFEVGPGDYFVDANVCCVGPGLIDYHVPITVAGGETEAVELQAFLVCV